MTTTDHAMANLLRDHLSIALVGVSPRPDDPTYDVAAYLQTQGYHLVPVTAGDDSVVGFRTYDTLADVTEQVDAMSVFLNSDNPPDLADDVRRLGVKAIWVQPGCSDAVDNACHQTGVEVYSNHCIMRDHQRLLGNADAHA